MSDVAVIAGSAVFLAVAIWVLVRRQRLSWRGRLPDVPDAPPPAIPIEAPGMTLPYSSLDPTAPPKQLQNPTGGDGAPEPD